MAIGKDGFSEGHYWVESPLQALPSFLSCLLSLSHSRIPTRMNLESPLSLANSIDWFQIVETSQPHTHTRLGFPFNCSYSSRTNSKFPFLSFPFLVFSPNLLHALKDIGIPVSRPLWFSFFIFSNVFNFFFPFSDKRYVCACNDFKGFLSYTITNGKCIGVMRNLIFFFCSGIYKTSSISTEFQTPESVRFVKSWSEIV